MTIKLLVVRIASFTFLVCSHYTGNRFSCRHENVSGSMSDNRIELEQVVYTHRTSNIVPERPVWPRGEVWCTKSVPKNIPSYQVGPSLCSLLLISLENLFTLRRKVAETYPICDDPLFKTAGGPVSLLNKNSRKITVLLDELTKAKSGIIFVSVQGLSGIVWLIIAFRVPQTPDINLPHNSVATIQCYERFKRVG